MGPKAPKNALPPSLALLAFPCAVGVIRAGGRSCPSRRCVCLCVARFRCAAERVDRVGDLASGCTWQKKIENVSKIPELARHGVSDAWFDAQTKEKTMPNFLCLQRSDVSQSASGESPSPAEMEKMYAQFGAWKEKFEKNFVDMGGKLGDGKLSTVDGVVDGPMVEAKELIGGYMILSADSLDEAIEIASACPGLVRPGSGVWVREINTP